MLTIINKMPIDLMTQDAVTVTLPFHIDINELHYLIEYEPDYSGNPLFLDAVDGKEKSILIVLDKTGVNQSALNPNNLFKTENFKVEKIVFHCFRKIKFSFTLERQLIKQTI